MKHRIWIRQGEGSDYVMNNSDPVNSEGLTIRTVTKRFSPYNLTAPTFQAPVDIPGASPVNPGIFTDYPSQAGAFFQWADDSQHVLLSRTRWAWNPYIIDLPTAPETVKWSSSQVYIFWAPYEAIHETCPPGYRRPNDGPTSGNDLGSNQSSELRQSLFEYPRNGFNYASNLNNVVYGYYADGFFDRHLITSTGTVATNSRDIAATGTLFYNPTTGSANYCASLFFCNAGSRHPTDGGKLTKQGTDTGYWTSSANHVDDPGSYYGVLLRLMYMASNNKHAGPWHNFKAEGNMIRCVQN
jgi:hypothetical protein